MKSMPMKDLCWNVNLEFVLYFFVLDSITYTGVLHYYKWIIVFLF